MTSRDQYTQYQICLEGRIEKRWFNWFEGLQIETNEDDQTIIRGEFDQSGLHGLFHRIRDLGVTLISVQRYTESKKAAD